MNRRRHVLMALGACVLAPPLTASAQATRVYRIGWISLGPSGAPSPFLDAFRQGLREYGYVEGRNVVMEVRAADGSREEADRMVRGLVQHNVDVLVAQGSAVWSAARHAAATPIVIGYSGDPVEAGFVKTLARPAG